MCLQYWGEGGSGPSPPLWFLRPCVCRTAFQSWCMSNIRKALLSLVFIVYFKCVNTFAVSKSLTSPPPHPTNAAKCSRTDISPARTVMGLSAEASTQLLRRYRRDPGGRVGQIHQNESDKNQDLHFLFGLLSQIVLCQNNIHQQSHMTRVVTHELIHAFDHCRAHVDWFNNYRHLACSEVKYKIIKLGKKKCFCSHVRVSSLQKLKFKMEIWARLVFFTDPGS